MNGEAIGERPMKPVTERLLLREFTQMREIARVTSRGRLPRGTRGDFDQFARRRTRELIGTTPAKTTFPEFFRRQSAAFQDDVIGPTRGRLFRRGGLRIGNFVDSSGKVIPLRDLARFHADAFEAAGLDPAAFRRPVGVN